MARTKAKQAQGQMEAAKWAARTLASVDPKEFGAIVGPNPARLCNARFVAHLTELLTYIHGRERARALTAAVLVRLQG